MSPGPAASACPAVLAALLVAGCAATTDQTGRFCESAAFLVDARFEAGSFDSCSFAAEDAVEIVVGPEDPPPINPSPWYAFRVEPRRPGEITVRLRFVHGYARYWPKLSRDLVHWARAEESRVRLAEDGGSLEVALTVGDEPLWVAGQEVVGTGDYDDWMGELAARPGVEGRILGRSVEGRPIRAVRSPARREVVLLLGRQHPPEVTGALAMRPFVETVLADTPLASEFRRRYAVVVVPLLNPDGVARGHWRHNAGGVDLNRDWGPFTQPETRSVARLLDELEAGGARPRLMLDFHSTKSTLCYTQLSEEPTDPPRFAGRWLERVRQRLPEFELAHQPRASSERPNTKNYFFRRYGIPAITVELGDEESREQIARAAPVLAEEMMRLLLEPGRAGAPG